MTEGGVCTGGQSVVCTGGRCGAARDDRKGTAYSAAGLPLRGTFADNHFFTSVTKTRGKVVIYNKFYYFCNGYHIGSKEFLNPDYYEKGTLLPLIFMGGGALLSLNSEAQDLALKTNILYDATATVNLGIEAALSQKWTFEVGGNYNNWVMPQDRRWKHWLVQPEGRYWFCNKFIGSFLGIHLHGGQYNFGNLKNNIEFLGSDFSPLSDNRYQGWFVGAGVAYGYSLVLSKHWNLEFELGVGYAYTVYDRYPCADCGERLEHSDHHYLGPTKAALNLVYLF